jgi:hypothetical protein
MILIGQVVHPHHVSFYISHLLKFVISSRQKEDWKYPLLDATLFFSYESGLLDIRLEI